VNRSYDPRQPSRLAFHVSRIVIDAGVLLVLGAMSLPFVTAEGFHQRAVAGDGLPALFLLIPIFVMTLLPDQSTPLPSPLAWVSLGLAAAALPYTVVKYLEASTLAGTVQGAVGMGARVLVMGAFLVLAGLVLGLVRTLFRTPEPEPARVEAREAAFAPAEAAAPAARPDPARRSRVPAPQSGTPATSRAATSPPTAAAPAAAPGAPPPSRSFPRWRRPTAARAEAPTNPASSSPPPQRPPARVSPRPRPADPDTEPTLPAQRPVQPWWPDDLEDLFS
jgi:hypothetical protein